MPPKKSIHQTAVATTTAPPRNLKAALIDDAFDEIGEDEVSINALKEFHQLGDEGGELEIILKDLNIDRPSLDDYSDNDPEIIEYVNKLFNSIGKNTRLDDFIRNLFVKRAEKLSVLNKICNNLELAGVIIEKFGSTLTEENLERFSDGSFSFLFIDYFLGPNETKEDIKRAERLAKLVFDKCPQESKPLTILMSSHPNVQERKNVFRENAELLEVSFEVSEKNKLANSNILTLKLKIFETLLPHSNKIQSYVSALSKAAQNALNLFQNEIRSLGIDDYAFIHHSSLKTEGHPLGDYMAWLYGSRWGSLLFEYLDFKKNLKIIDELDIPGPLLMNDTPSDHIAKIYVSALFEDHIDKLAPDPKYGYDGLPQLNLGDIFTKDENSLVWMVINPQCDLVRKIPPELSIILVPGKLSSLEDAIDTGKKTDFFFLKDIRYRVYWKLNKVFSVPYKDILKWKRREKLNRTHRLKLPFALDIQQSFASNISRVGIPVAPPANNSISIEVVTNRGGKPIVILKEGSRLAFKMINREKSGEKYKVQLTTYFAEELKLTIVENLRQLESDLRTFTDSGKVNKKLSSEVESNKKFIAEFDNWFVNNSSFYFTDKVIETGLKLSNFISVQVNADKERYLASTPFLINIKTKILESISDISIKKDSEGAIEGKIDGEKA